MAWKYSEAQAKLLKDTVDRDKQVSNAALSQLASAVQKAIALELPVRKGLLSGDIHSNIFEEIVVTEGNTTAEFPLHYMTPGTEDEYVAFTIPNYGSVPQKLIQGDYVNIPLVDIAGSIDWDNKYAKNARWDIVSDAMQNLQGQITKKLNDMAWHTLISAGYDRGVIIADTDAAQGQFTTRLVSLLKTVVRRNGGGNSSSINRSKLTDLYVSPEAIEDMRSWNVDQLDELSRREIFVAEDGMINRIFSVNIHDIDELGEGQEYELFYENTLGGTLPTTGGHTDVEIVVGLDQSANRSFVMPTDGPIEMVPDNTRVRHRQTGMLAFKNAGFGVLDSRSVLLGSY